MKKCRSCTLEFPIIDFVKNHTFKDGIDTICLSCSRSKVKQWRKKNPEKRKEQWKRESRKDYTHNKHLKHTYGITREQYLEMFTAQKGNCAICGRHQLNFKRRLSVDHCHKTGLIRALLCSSCNYILGNVDDKPEILKNAILYLERYSNA